MMKVNASFVFNVVVVVVVEARFLLNEGLITITKHYEKLLFSERLSVLLLYN
jgi:hypothetical protein